jgi:DNA-binding Lrp family transcriptional regulator
MPKAFILLNVETGSEDEVLNQLKNLAFVEESFVAYGGYDLIIKVKADSMTELKNTVSQRIRTLDKVRSTLTLLLTEE